MRQDEWPNRNSALLGGISAVHEYRERVPNGACNIRQTGERDGVNNIVSTLDASRHSTALTQPVPWATYEKNWPGFTESLMLTLPGIFHYTSSYFIASYFISFPAVPPPFACTLVVAFHI